MFWTAVMKAVGVFVLLLGNTVFLIWAERKFVADMQNRLGPMRAGPFGVLQTVADGLKLFFKEQITPRQVERLVYFMAPMLSVIPAFLLFMVIPVAQPFMMNGVEVVPAGVDLDIGLLYILALSSVAVYAIVFAGWSSGSKYPLIGGVRATAQAISYEAAMGLSMVAVVMFMAGTAGLTNLSLVEIVNGQQEQWFNIGAIAVSRWNVFFQFVAFAIFAVAIVAETNRAPFDLVEAEQEIVGGFHTEYSGMRFAMFFLAEYVNMFTMSAIAVSLFLGGFGGPTFGLEGILASLVSFAWFMFKTWILLFCFVWVRATLPRLRYDQLMTLGWKRLIPAALGWLIVTTLFTAFREFGAPWA